MTAKKPKPKELRLSLKDVKMVKADGVLIGDARYKGRKYRTVLIPLDRLQEAKED